MFYLVNIRLIEQFAPSFESFENTLIDIPSFAERRVSIKKLFPEFSGPQIETIASFYILYSVKFGFISMLLIDYVHFIAFKTYLLGSIVGCLA